MARDIADMTAPEFYAHLCKGDTILADIRWHIANCPDSQPFKLHTLCEKAHARRLELWDVAHKGE
jgi:hypothetical protein